MHFIVSSTYWFTNGNCDIFKEASISSMTPHVYLCSVVQLPTHLWVRFADYCTSAIGGEAISLGCKIMSPLILEVIFP